MMDRQKGKWVVQCDGCSDEVLETGTDVFQEAVAAARDEGWGLRKNKQGDWENYCPKCSDGP